MNFGQTVAAVVEIIKRPDKASDVKREVNSAISNFSVDAEFERDLAEISLPLDNTQYSQSLALSLLPRYRKIWYVKYGGTRKRIKKASLTSLFDLSCDMRDRYYISGSNMNIQLATLASSLDVGFFQFPPLLTAGTDEFWMLDLIPHMVIDRAAGKLFTSIGDAASAQRHEAFAVAAYQSARRDFGAKITDMDS